MKKRAVILSTLLISSILVTGCSWGDVKNKFTGNDTASGGAVSGSGVIAVEDYNAEECVSIPEYKGVEVDCAVDSSEIEAEIKSELANHNKEKKVKNRACKMNDTVNIDYVGKVDGKEFDGGSAKGYNLVLGSKSFIDGFEKGVVGMKAGQKKDLKLKFPDPYNNNKELSGKKVIFTVTLNYISETVEAKLNEKFVKDNTDYKTVDDYKKSIKDKLLKNKKDSAGQTGYGQVEEKAEVKKYPNGMKERYIEQLKAYYTFMAKSYYGSKDLASFLKQQNMTEQQFEEQTLSPSAEKMAKTQLLTEAIAAKEGIQVTDDDIKAEIEKITSQQGSDIDKLREEYKSMYGEVMTLEDYFRTMLIQNKVVELVGQNAKIKE